MGGEKNDVPVVAWRYWRPGVPNGYWDFAGAPMVPSSEPLVRQSDHLAVVDKLTRERDEAINDVELLRDNLRATTEQDSADLAEMDRQRLSAEAKVEKLREVLRPLADAASSFDTMPVKDPEQWLLWSTKSNHPDFPSKEITVGDARRARAALSERGLTK